MMLRIRYLRNQLVAQRANKESKKSYKEEISLTFKYGEVVPLKRPKVIFGKYMKIKIAKLLKI